MTNTDTALSRQVRITNELGLHARAAAKIAGLVKGANRRIWLTKNGDKVDASSILDILTLACEKDSRIIVTVEDSNDIDILTAIEQMVESGFGE
ncbi:MAG: HPr family phosphocarrier protein [Desulfobacterales bacterium]